MTVDAGAAGGGRDSISLDSEHGEVLDALRRGGAARDRLVSIILDVAAERWPDRWRSLRPVPIRLATWVGYDMDGRTDIGWATSIGYRLIEKAERLTGYVAALRGIDPAHALLADLAAAEAHTREMVAIFAADLTDPADLSAAANRLTAPHPGKLLSLVPIFKPISK